MEEVLLSFEKMSKKKNDAKDNRQHWGKDEEANQSEKVHSFPPTIYRWPRSDKQSIILKCPVNFKMQFYFSHFKAN